uniref:G-protein coupled receptors family 2 profile 2 domain-containing protein n=1 Tax=Eucampia antarctica TaxID=49252 RepID=A0A7S2VZK4_9STRA|mmetsp:Transcript_12481/g.12097  ORF Transcript_12481/g.12097 Transcript_12481/m.12097 type:complete len:399 (+) Transcript_12481:118-1314(+)
MENRLSWWQQKALAIAPKFGAFLSLASSTYTIVDICQCPDRKGKVYHRLVLVMLTVNIISSALQFVGTWALPNESGMYLASGTKGTCTVQGTIYVFSILSKMIYFSMLPLFSYLAIRCDFDEIKLRRYEPWFHITALPWPIASAVIGGIKGFMNPSGPWCFVARNPPGCENNGNCNHGKMQGYILMNLGTVCTFFILANVMIVAAFILVRKKQKQNMSLIGKKKVVEGFRQNRATAVKRQAALYFGALYLTFGFSLISRIIQTIRKSIHFPTLIIGVILVSFDGCINVFVYDRTRLKKSTVSSKNEADSNHALSTLVTEIRRNAYPSQNDTQKERLGNRKREDKPFSIFDGTSNTRRPSSIWAAFIVDDEDLMSEEVDSEGSANEQYPPMNKDTKTSL